MNNNYERESIKLKKCYGKFVKVPLELLINPEYNRIKFRKQDRLRHNSIILYSILMQQQEKQKQFDETGRAYVEITLSEIAMLTGTKIGETTTNMISQLIEFGLIEKENRNGQSNIYYVKVVE